MTLDSRRGWVSWAETERQVSLDTCFLQREPRRVEDGRALRGGPASGQEGVSISRTASQQRGMGPDRAGPGCPHTSPRGLGCGY